MSRNSVKALFYGINGTGLGHISRLLNIARSTREILHAQGLTADFHFITTSEASQMAWDFPVYKLPSKTVIAGCDTKNKEFAAQSQFFISNLVALIDFNKLQGTGESCNIMHLFIYSGEYFQRS